MTRIISVFVAFMLLVGCAGGTNVASSYGGNGTQVSAIVGTMQGAQNFSKLGKTVTLPAGWDGRDVSTDEGILRVAMVRNGSGYARFVMTQAGRLGHASIQSWVEASVAPTVRRLYYNKSGNYTLDSASVAKAHAPLYDQAGQRVLTPTGTPVQEYGEQVTIRPVQSQNPSRATRTFSIIYWEEAGFWYYLAFTSDGYWDYFSQDGRRFAAEMVRYTTVRNDTRTAAR